MVKFKWVMACMWVFSVWSIAALIHGRYTKSLNEYHLAIPHKLTLEGDFASFHLPHFHDHNSPENRRKRSLEDPEMLHYGVQINDQLYHLELWPNRDFLHPGMVIEKRNPEIEIKQRYVRTLKGKKLCHYTGRVRGYPQSRAAISTCDGLAGYVVIGNRKYYIEPVDNHSPNSEGHHLHVVYDKPNVKMKKCGTKESWENAIKKRFKEQALQGQDIFKVKKRSEVVNRYLEVGVVCDKTFLRFHKQRDVELYVMTVMNMVADYYHDASVGHQIDLTVVRIIYLEKEEKEIDLEINRDSGKTLKSFCDWAIKINTPEDSPNHFDVAILLTRYDLCAQAEEDCGLSGLAYVGGVCSKDQKCGINEDSGLMLSVIVAHEIGHLFGAQHDSQDTPCAVQDTDGSYFVMSPIVSSNTIRWSTCSKSLINTLLDNNLGQCLSDLPQSTLYPFADNLPGVVYDASEQCKFMIPTSLGVCSGIKEKICEDLICKMNAKNCIGKGEIPADGTKCAENKWCFNKKCIEMGARPEAINGGWGDWGPWSECSRSCGGGLTYSERDCNNPIPANKGRYCLGQRKRMKICNPLPCPDGSPTFRQQQCTEENGKPWNGEYHKWVSRFKEDEPCALYCVNENNVLSKLEPVTKDGTPCKHGTKNICISGVCRVVGCDNVLESDAVEDRCGVCNGDGTQCKIVEEVYKDIGRGYTKVAVIPAGARKVVIEEKAPSKNTIALTDSTEKKFYLNGDNTENLDNEYNIGDNIGVYAHVEPKKEKFIMEGPLKEDVVFFVIQHTLNTYENPGFFYSWAEPSVDSTYEPRYHWELGEFEECSVACGGGTQRAVIDCMEEKAGKVSSNFCAGIDKPADIVKNCNEEPCKKKWEVGPWGHCRACRNKGGVRTRAVECVQVNPKKGADYILLDDEECEGPKPGSVELCKTDEKCGRKRMTSTYIPGKFQKNIWMQMNRKFPEKRNINCDPKELAKQLGHNLNLTNVSISITKTKFVHDFKPLDEQVLYKYTILPSPFKSNLSDKADSQMGDLIGDVIDTENKKVFKGKIAAEMLHKMEYHLNSTMQFNCHSLNHSQHSQATFKLTGKKPERGDTDKNDKHNEGATAKPENGKRQGHNPFSFDWDDITKSPRNKKKTNRPSEETEEASKTEIEEEATEDNRKETEVNEDKTHTNKHIKTTEQKTNRPSEETEEASKTGIEEEDNRKETEVNEDKTHTTKHIKTTEKENEDKSGDEDNTAEGKGNTATTEENQSDSDKTTTENNDKEKDRKNKINQGHNPFSFDWGGLTRSSKRRKTTSITNEEGVTNPSEPDESDKMSKETTRVKQSTNMENTGDIDNENISETEKTERTITPEEHKSNQKDKVTLKPKSKATTNAEDKDIEPRIEGKEKGIEVDITTESEEDEEEDDEDGDDDEEDGETPELTTKLNEQSNMKEKPEPDDVKKTKEFICQL